MRRIQIRKVTGHWMVDVPAFFHDLNPRLTLSYRSWRAAMEVASHWPYGRGSKVPRGDGEGRAPF